MGALWDGGEEGSGMKGSGVDVSEAMDMRPSSSASGSARPNGKRGGEMIEGDIESGLSTAIVWKSLRNPCRELSRSG
jgi:hypothetical protein